MVIPTIYGLIPEFEGRDQKSTPDIHPELYELEERKKSLLERAQRHDCASSVQQLLEQNKVEEVEELLRGLD